MPKDAGIVDPSLDSSSNLMGSQSASQMDLDGVHLNVILDSGSSVHATGDASLLKGTRAARCGDAASVTRRDGKEMDVLAVGSVRTAEFAVDDVHYVPGLGPHVVIAVSRLADCGLLITFCGALCLVMDRTGVVFGEGRIQGDGEEEEEEGFYHLTFLRIPSSSSPRDDPPAPCPPRSHPPDAASDL